MNATARATARRKPMPAAHAPKRKQLMEGLAAEAGSPQQLIDVARIDKNPLQIRAPEAFTENDPDLLSLVESLKGVNLISPIHVEKSSAPERWTLIAGERRLTAAKMAGWPTIPAFVHQGLSLAQKIELAADENLSRKALSILERAQQFVLLMKPIEAGGAGMTREAVATRYGYQDPSSVRNIVKLLELPAIWQQRIAAGELDQKHGRALHRFIKRPDVLAAADADYERRPENWTRANDVELRLNEIAGRLDSLSATAQEGEDFEALTDGDLPALPLTRRSAPVDHTTPPETELSLPLDDELSADAIARVLDSVFDVLDRLRPEQLGPVILYAERRARGIESPGARLPSKRAARA
jgi:ParB/RepB/Spo0J family partition protein